MARKATTDAEPAVLSADEPKKSAARKTASAGAAKETKKATRKTPEKTVKETADKETAPKKTATRRTAAKKTEANTEVYVQYWGKEVYAKDVVAAVKKIWIEEMGKKESELQDLKVYIKPEDNGAHYVINDEITGFLGL